MKFISGGGRRIYSSRRAVHGGQRVKTSADYREEEARARAAEIEFEDEEDWSQTRTVRQRSSAASSRQAAQPRSSQGARIPSIDISSLRRENLPHVVHSEDNVTPPQRPYTPPVQSVPRNPGPVSAPEQPGQRTAAHAQVRQSAPARTAPAARTNTASAYRPASNRQAVQQNTYRYDRADFEEPVSYRPYSVSDRHRRQQQKSSAKRRIITLSTVVAVLAALYLFVVYTNIPFVAKWRTIYIETALMTRTHQWLATAFIPKSVVDKTRATIDQLEESQNNLESDWSGAKPIATTTLPAITRPSAGVSEPTEQNPDDPVEDVPIEELPFWKDPNSEFCMTYTELDMDSFAAYAEEHEDEMFDENGNLFIDEAGLDQEGTSIRTVQGDQVLALDTIHGIIIVRLEGDTDAGHYRGVLAIVKDPSRIGVAIAKRLGIVGQKIGSMAEDNEAILAINASGFEDPEGGGNGGIVYGMLYAAGKKYKGTDGGTYKAGYFDYDNRLHVGTWKNTTDIRDGVEFKPLLVVNGEQAITGSAGWGIHPRTAIGQTEDGTVIMLVIDGRQPTYSVGVTVGYTAELMLKYGCVQALNLDGGSSSIMYFNGRKLTKPSGGDKVNGRYLPDAFVVYANRRATDGLTNPNE